MKTLLHHYYFNLTDPAEKAAWDALRAKLKASRVHLHETWGGKNDNPPKRTDSEEVEIETAFLFEDQWNTTTSRVFDWFKQYEIHGAKLARGHWLELTPELLQVRAETLKCGYCGQHYGPHHPTHRPIPASLFCDACLDSPYLKETELHLLRLQPLSTPRKDSHRAPLSVEERATLLPRYIDRQTTGTDSRAKQQRDKQRSDVLKKFEKETADALAEKDGMLWIWDAGLSLDNVIYYSHTGVFSFGWRSPVSESVARKLDDTLKGFPFPYEIKEQRAAA